MRRLSLGACLVHNRRLRVSYTPGGYLNTVRNDSIRYSSTALRTIACVPHRLLQMCAVVGGWLTVPPFGYQNFDGIRSGVRMAVLAGGMEMMQHSGLLTRVFFSNAIIMAFLPPMAHGGVVDVYEAMGLPCVASRMGDALGPELLGQPVGQRLRLPR